MSDAPAPPPPGGAARAPGPPEDYENGDAGKDDRSSGAAAREPLAAQERRGGGPPAAFIRPKGNVTRGELLILLALAIIPLLVALTRLLGLPGIVDPHSAPWVLQVLRSFGGWLNDVVTLDFVHGLRRDMVFFLVFLPTCALIIAVARMTFGLRVFGFRSILIAMGFRESGVLPSIMILVIVITTVVLIRPRLKTLRLRYYPRVSTLICIVAMILVAVLVFSSAEGFGKIWSSAFFPVLILALLAEAFASTLEKENWGAAVMRIGSTCLLAFPIAVISLLPIVRMVLLNCPELMLTQTVGIVLIAEFLDLKLLQDTFDRLTDVPQPRLITGGTALRVAVVRNRDSMILGWLGQAGPQEALPRAVQRIADGLRDGGHTVRVLEGDIWLLSALRDFIPSHPRTGEPGGLVFNLSEGVQGDARFTHLPAMFQMSGIAHTGPTMMGHFLAHDRLLSRLLLQRAGVRTPAFCLLSSPDERPTGVSYPLVLKPRRETSYRMTVVNDRRELRQALMQLMTTHDQQVLAEELIVGREINAPLLGNDPIECLPLVEVEAETRRKICPAEVDEQLAGEIRKQAMAAFKALGHQDYARVNLRVSAAGEPHVIEIDALGALVRNGSLVLAAEKAGTTYSQLVCRIVEIARERYVNGPPLVPAIVARTPYDEDSEER